MFTQVAALSGQVLAIEHGLGQSHVLWRMFVAVTLTWAIGFEREYRNASAGDRTFALIGLGSAVIGYLAVNDAPNALAGVVTGIGFIGAGVIIHSRSELQGEPDPRDEPEGEHKVHGITTAATIYLAATIGAAAGQGQMVLAAVSTVAAILLLEIRHNKHLRYLDGRRYAEHRREVRRARGKPVEDDED